MLRLRAARSIPQGAQGFSSPRGEPVGQIGSGSRQPVGGGLFVAVASIAAGKQVLVEHPTHDRNPQPPGKVVLARASEDVAFAHSLNRLSGTLTGGTTATGFWVRATTCFRKVNGHWLIAHDHVSMPLDLTTGTPLLNLEP